jgi:hypothetical protein
MLQLIEEGMKKCPECDQYSYSVKSTPHDKMIESFGKVISDNIQSVGADLGKSPDPEDSPELDQNGIKIKKGGIEMEVNWLGMFDVYIFNEKAELINKEDDIVAEDAEDAKFKAKTDVILRKEGLTPKTSTIRTLRKFDVPVLDDE